MRVSIIPLSILILAISGCIGVEEEIVETSLTTTVSTTLTTTVSTSTVSTTSTVQPTCTDNRRNQNESGVDCGGPCNPCPSCFDNIRNQDELGVDCGVQCEPCDSECFSDADCGTEHYTGTYCYDDNTKIVRYLVNYECLNPGYPKASCRLVKEPEVTDKCTSAETCLRKDFCPNRTCLEARCIRKTKVCDWIMC